MSNKNFLKEEIRNDFFVDYKRKKLWLSELNMLEDFGRICEKYNLKYFLMAGGMLGAVRHKGFIPWDDDIDIGMLRCDYDKFMEVAEKELNKKYFLQTGMNEEKYFDVIVRIRDARTTGIIMKDILSPCNNGVFIEIFPYDNVPEQKILAKHQDIMIRLYKTHLFRNVYTFPNENIVKTIAWKMLSSVLNLFNSKDKIFKKFEYWCKKYQNMECEYVNILSAYSYRDAFKYPRKIVENTIKTPYEYTYSYIPKDYDYCLKKTYKNYMDLPDIELRGAKHNDIVIYDATIGYNKYLNEISKNEKEKLIKNKAKVRG